MYRLFYVLVLTVALVPVTACGDDSSPTAPSPTTTSVNVTVSSPLRMGQTTQATGTETLSNGQTRTITSGWLSDAPSVATVTTGGLVTGVGNGRASINVTASGRQGQQVVRVVPDYQGRWDGGLRVTSCTETGIFADIDFCDDFPAGITTGYSLALSQSGEQMTATASYGDPITFPPVPAPIREDGTAAFAPSLTFTQSGVTLTVDASFNINSARVGELTGNVSEVWRVPNFNGEGRLVQDIVSTVRSSTTTLSIGLDGSARLRSLRRLTGRKD